jgi:hypothetical protein
MPPDVRDLLHRAAASPDEWPDLDALLARGRRRVQNRRLVAWTGPLAVLAIVASALLFVRATPEHPPAQATPAFVDRPLGWSVLPAPPNLSEFLGAAWTGDKLLAWGRSWQPGVELVGHAFEPRTGSWTEMAAFPLGRRESPGWAWTGRELLLWGGLRYGSGTVDKLGDGAAYDPEHDTWRPLPPAPISTRAPLSAWTGREFIVWGDQPVDDATAPTVYDGAAYDPVTNTWRRIADAPLSLASGAAVWTGQEVIVLGPQRMPAGDSEATGVVGAAYRPDTNTWRRLPDPDLRGNAPVTTAWNGNELVTAIYEGPTAAYDPTRDAWRAVPNVGPYGSCGAQNAAVDRLIFLNRCVPRASDDIVGVFMYDPATNRWNDITMTDMVLSSGVLVGAGPVVILLGRTDPAGDSVMYSYRPPG